MTAQSHGSDPLAAERTVMPSTYWLELCQVPRVTGAVPVRPAASGQNSNPQRANGTTQKASLHLARKPAVDLTQGLWLHSDPHRGSQEI